MMPDAQESASRLNPDVPHPARRYNYWLGGKDNFAADRESGDAVASIFPSIRTAVIENRYFLRRAVSLLAGELGIRQFLDIGTGLPTADNTHEVAQRIAPESSVVYVDNDPLVMVHARSLLTAAPGAGPTSYLEADVRSPEYILREAARTLDFSRPIGLMMIAILHFIADEEDPHGLVGRLVSALPPGSYLVLSHSTSDYLTPDAVQSFRTGAIPVYLRPHDDVARFFDGLDVLDPGVVSISNWRAEHEPEPRPDESETATDCAVARVR
jgi:S-adenosyl methyltransferase